MPQITALNRDFKNAKWMAKPNINSALQHYISFGVTFVMPPPDGFRVKAINHKNQQSHAQTILHPVFRG